MVRGRYIRGSRLLYLEIAKLCELLAAAFEPASEGFCLLVNDLVCTHVASLGKPFSAGFARVGSFAGMAALMGLRRVNCREH